MIAGRDRGALRAKIQAESAALLANGIRHLREDRQLTQQGLAELMGVGQSAVARWEDPAYRGWTLKSLIKIAVALRARLRVGFEEQSALLGGVGAAGKDKQNDELE